ncbi:MAG: hypothetical protein ACK4K7_07355 [Allosphingosinicella sp.]|uniref:hypothetical protein n=1 Tax=Allosphingosinicella sp. TaxID=2823234 RepID=UPI00394998BF
MSRVRILGSLLMVGVLASCAVRPAQEVPPPAPPAPAPELPPPPPPPAGADWRDVPLTAGAWTYANSGGQSSAMFGPPGQPRFIVRCERSREVTLLWVGAPAAQAITLRTTYGARSLAARAYQGPQPAVGATVPASDPSLDAIAFSRGRFTVEAAGAPMLVIPAWPEPARVIEDCRA